MLKKIKTEFKENHVKGLSFQGFHRVHYTEWGEDRNGENSVVCVHGVSRNGRDFDYLARKMKDEYRLICPDMVGRGKSDHLKASEGYDYLQYNADMNVLLARLNVPKVDWIGTSMGGIIGMVFAAQSQTPIRRLILNDIGPFIKRDRLNEIGEYIGRSGEFRTQKLAEAYLREAYSEFGPMSDEDWAEMVEHSTYRTRKGLYRMRLDPGVGDSFRERISLFDVNMWDSWDNILCPVLILRGKDSTFFARETAEEMLSRGPQATLVEFDGCGHTPTLRDDAQCEVVMNWLKDTETA